MNRILIVVSEQITGEVLQKSFSSSGFQTAVVWSSAQMLDFCRQHTPDLGLIDLDGSEEGMWSSIQALKGIGSLANLPLVGICSEDDPSIMDQAKNHGFRAVFPKNSSPSAIMDFFKSIMEPSAVSQNDTTSVSPRGDFDPCLNRLLQITSEVIQLTEGLKSRIAEFGEDGPELFGYIENSGGAIKDKLGSLPPHSLHDKELRHDFRNMIGSVTGFAELIMMEPAISPDSHQSLGQIREHSRVLWNCSINKKQNLSSKIDSSISIEGPIGSLFL